MAQLSFTGWLLLDALPTIFISSSANLVKGLRLKQKFTTTVLNSSLTCLAALLTRLCSCRATLICCLSLDALQMIRSCSKKTSRQWTSRMLFSLSQRTKPAVLMDTLPSSLPRRGRLLDHKSRLLFRNSSDPDRF